MADATDVPTRGELADLGIFAPPPEAPVGGEGLEAGDSYCQQQVNAIDELYNNIQHLRQFIFSTGGDTVNTQNQADDFFLN